MKNKKRLLIIVTILSVIAVAASYFLLEKSYPDIVSYSYSGKKFHLGLKSNGSTCFL